MRIEDGWLLLGKWADGSKLYRLVSVTGLARAVGMMKVITVGRYGSATVNFESGGIRMSRPVWAIKRYSGRLTRDGRPVWTLDQMWHPRAGRDPSNVLIEAAKKAAATEGIPYVPRTPRTKVTRNTPISPHPLTDVATFMVTDPDDDGGLLQVDPLDTSIRMMDETQRTAWLQVLDVLRVLPEDQEPPEGDLELVFDPVVLDVYLTLGVRSPLLSDPDDLITWMKTLEATT